jgi:hypothetical protein
MIWFRMGRTQSSIQDRLGLLQVVTINSVMSSLSKTLNVGVQGPGGGSYTCLVNV